MGFGIDEARQRVIDAMHAGRWSVVDDNLTAYAAAVRADERHKAIDEAVQAVRDSADRDNATATDCLTAVQRLA